MNYSTNYRGSLSNSLHNNYLTATNGLIDSSFEIPPQSRVILEVVSCEWEYFSANFNIEVSFFTNLGAQYKDCKSSVREPEQQKILYLLWGFDML